MGVLLVIPPERYYRRYIWNYASIPTRSAYLAGILERAKIDYDILDMNIASLNVFGIKGHNARIASLNTNPYRSNNLALSYLSWMSKKIANTDPYTHMAINGDNPTMALNILRFSKIAQPKAFNIIGGRRVSDNWMNCDDVDGICSGYAENALPGMINENAGTELRNIRYLHTENPTELQSPSYTKIDLEQYFKYFNFANIISSVGCPNECHYCGFSCSPKPVTRSIESIKREIKMFNGHGITNFSFLDNYINISSDHMRRVDTLMKQTGSRYGGFMRADSDAGSDALFFATLGIESASPDIQRKIGKNLDLGVAKETLQKMKSNKTIVRASMMYDLPGETWKDFRHSVRYSKDFDHVWFNKLHIQPGSRMYQRPEEYFEYIKRENCVERLRTYPERLQLLAKHAVASMHNTKDRRRYETSTEMEEFVHS